VQAPVLSGGIGLHAGIQKPAQKQPSPPLFKCSRSDTVKTELHAEVPKETAADTPTAASNSYLLECLLDTACVTERAVAAPGWMCDFSVNFIPVSGDIGGENAEST
jgi:hypothetical protein